VNVKPGFDFPQDAIGVLRRSRDRTGRRESAVDFDPDRILGGPLERPDPVRALGGDLEHDDRVGETAVEDHPVVERRFTPVE